jgi:hypothetical protein
MMHDDDNWKHYRDGAFRGFADYLEAGESFIKPFVFYFVGDVNVEKDYDLRLMAFNSYKDGIHFTPKSGTNTYWTADQHVKPLPQEGMELKVPKEAVAVDFRGNYGVDDVFTVDVTEANPNCLYYLNNLDYVPKGLDYDRLVIRDYAIRDLVIDERHDFYCPMPFEAKTALLTVTPEGKEAFDKNSEATGSCSGTITLPFDAQRIQLTDVNGESTLGQDGLTFFRFATMQAPSMERRSMILPRRFRIPTFGWMRLWQTCSRKLTRVWASRTRFSSSLPRALRMLRLPTCRSIASRQALCI